MEAPISSSLGAMSSLFGKLDYLLESQHLLRKPVKKGIELLKEDLERINISLLELSNEDNPSQTKKCWMKEVREVSYDIEDYIDRLIHSEAKIGSVGVVPRLKISKLPSTLNRRRPKIANQIQELRARLEDAGERHKRYVLDNVTPSNVPYGRSITTMHRGEASRLLVGINDDLREKLVKLLNDGEKQLKVISVFGIGGIGKTTLVKQLFEDHASQFGFRAFVRASRKPDTRNILQSIISQTRCRHPSGACNVEELIACLNEHLQNRRYLIVIDDLWDTTFWDVLLRAFSDGNHSSRIITTTSIKNVAMTCCGDQSDYVQMMEPLNIDDSRKLFLTRVFGSEDKCLQQFKDASDEIVRKCGGVPLAIINIAGLLARQPNRSDLWDYVQKSLGSNLSICPTTEGVVSIINLGYNGLPNCLKTCLQYVTLYPENCTIWKDDLLRRWVAEGFISPNEGNDMEAVAQNYFEELVYRGMIQPMDFNYNEEVLSCTVHNLVLDLLINKSTEDNFITAIDYSMNNGELCNKVRRLHLFFSKAKYAAKPSGVTLSQVRSLAFYGLIKCMPSVREFEFLRVLFVHFSGDYSGHAPFNLTGICRLFQLRYFKVKSNFSIQLPTHIEGLYHLETLDLDAKVAHLPADIIYLQHLLHLRLPSNTSMPNEMGRMRSLRTLKCFDLLCSNSEDNVRSLEELTNLQELQLICTTLPSDNLDRNLDVLCSILGSFCNLKSLALRSAAGYSVTCRSTSVIDSSSMSFPPVCLEKFEMHPAICIFSGFPEWVKTLRRLCILKIAVTEFLQGDMDSLGKLPGLTVLSLYVQKPTVDLIVVNSGTFPVLKYFKFRCTILSLAFGKEAMPNLRRLKVCFKLCRGLGRLAGIQHLQNLQEVALRIGLPTVEYDSMAGSKVEMPWFQFDGGEHRRIHNFDIQYVNWTDEDDYAPALNTIDMDRILEEILHDDSANKDDSESRLSEFSEKIISSPDLLSSVPDQVTEVISIEGEVITQLENGSYTNNVVHEISSSIETVTITEPEAGLSIIASIGESNILSNRSGALDIASGSTNTAEVHEIEVEKDEHATKGKVNTEEYDLEKILDEQETHNLYCPCCKSCITRRLILEERKRTARQAKREEPPKRPRLEEPAANVSNQTPVENHDQESPEVFRCLSCFTLFIPTGCGFNIFRIFERRDANQQVEVQHPAASQETSEHCGSWLLSCFQTVDSPKKSTVADSQKEPLLSGPHSTDNTISVEYSASSSQSLSHLVAGSSSTVQITTGKNEEEIKQPFSEYHGTTSSIVTVHTSSSSKSETDIQGNTTGASGNKSFFNQPFFNPELKVPAGFKKFSLSELEEATHKFLKDNIIGQGAFATVYKGALLDGLVVAIKKIQYPYQLSMKDICDKLTYVSKLEHKNIVQLIGYGHGILETIERFQDKEGSGSKDDLFLVEEYMPNGSLDNIIQGSQPDWSSRLLLIQGIAHGLQYLHEQQFVHLDLKPSNVLIDSDMIPKITDFGTARMLDQGNDVTVRDADYLLAGTMGYMPPEYIMEGIVSKMYDVYSFGVILLETISGMCGSKPARRQSSIAWAWVAREAGRMEDLLDPSLCLESQLHEARRCLEIGLLCTQSDRADRPTMLDVVEMLETEKELPTPKQPKLSHPILRTKPNAYPYVCQDQVSYI